MTAEIIEQSAPLTFASERYEPAKYEDVARKARVREVRLVDSSYSAKVASFLAASNGNGDAAELKQSYTGMPSHYTFSPEKGMLAGTYHWSAEVKCGRKKILKLSAEYLVVYSGLKDAPEDYVRLYFNKLARFTSYPYFRAHFAMNVASSGLMLAPLPSLFDRVD